MKGRPRGKNNILENLTQEELTVIQHIDSYINQDLALPEKLRLARLIAVMDLEYDETTANGGSFPAEKVLRVTNSVLAKITKI